MTLDRDDPSAKVYSTTTTGKNGISNSKMSSRAHWCEAMKSTAPPVSRRRDELIASHRGQQRGPEHRIASRSSREEWSGGSTARDTPHRRRIRNRPPEQKHGRSAVCSIR